MNRADFDDENADLPCADGLLAGTLALMTCWAWPEPQPALCARRQRALMAGKIASNLFFLREHPGVPPGLRLVAAKLHARWHELAGSMHDPEGAAAPHEPSSDRGTDCALH